MSYRIAVTVEQSFEDALAHVRDELAEQGFGVLTEIDVQSTMKAKLGAEIDAYVILGACNPSLTYQALQIEPSLGALLPCNVVVRTSTAGVTIVEAVDPATFVELTGNEDLRSVASEVRSRLAAVLGSLTPRTVAVLA